MQLFHGSLQFNQQCSFTPGPFATSVYFVDDGKTPQWLSIEINGKETTKVYPGKDWTSALNDKDNLTICAMNGTGTLRYVVAIDAVSTIQPKTEMRKEVART